MMDMDVNTSAFTSAARLRRHGEEIIHTAEALLHNFTLASRDYDTPVYRKSMELVEDVVYSARDFKESVDGLIARLKKLERAVDDYSGTGYRG